MVLFIVLCVVVAFTWRSILGSFVESGLTAIIEESDLPAEQKELMNDWEWKIIKRRGEIIRRVTFVEGAPAVARHEGNFILYENLHVSYELFENFFPLMEFNGLQYLSNGDRLPLDVGGLDYANIGSNNVRGNSTFWGAVGFRFKAHKNVEVGATYEFPLSTRHNDIFDQRVTASVILGL